MRLIDADALKARFYMKDDCSDCHACDYDETYIDPGIICSTIDYMPTIEPERKKGKWVEKDEYDDPYYECSACGASWVTIEGTPQDNKMNYCPNCGADMRGE